MPRRARLRIAGFPLHLIQRGNNRSACFYADEGCSLYLHHLAGLSREFNCAVHAYVLMTTVREIRAATNGGYALGSSRFKSEIAAMLGRRVEPGQSGRPKKHETSTVRV